MEFQVWLAFITIWAISVIGVGANSLVCMTAGATNGFHRGIWSAVGVTAASFTHSLFAAFGFSALMLAYAGAYHLLKWLAVGYLIFMGIRQWSKTPTRLGDSGLPQESRYALFRRGLLVSLTNPQAFLHYLVFYMPFLDMSRPLLPQLTVLIPTAVGMVFMAYARSVIVGSPIRTFLTSERRQIALNRISGSSFILFGLVLSMASEKR